MRLLVIFVLVIGLSLMAASVYAQDECDPQTAMDRLTSDVNALDLTSPDAFLLALQDLQFRVAEEQAMCTGLTFNSDIEGGNAVIGPVEFPAGLYIAELTTGAEGAGASISVKPLDGACSADGFSETLFFSDQGMNDQTTFESEGCTALIETTIYGDTVWDLQFSLLR